jgi:hypothetical protein
LHQSAIADIADDSQRERRVNRQHLFGIEPKGGLAVTTSATVKKAARRRRGEMVMLGLPSVIGTFKGMQWAMGLYFNLSCTRALLGLLDR